MKDFTLLTLVILFVCTSSYSQQVTGSAVYQTQRHVEMATDSTSGMSSDIQKSIQEQLRKQFQKEYVLTFSSTESIWEEEVNLQKPQAPSNGGISIVLSGNSDVLYQNIREKNFVKQSDLMGKQFLIEDTLEKLEWKLEKETKNIGKYTCFKATLTEELESFKMINGKEEVGKETRITTAWYTLDIPAQLGPDRFWGLPGLILEINDGKQAMMCTKVVINPKEEIVINTPTKGKKVTKEEYDQISKAKAKEMMERYSSPSTKKGDSQMMIKIGG